MARLPSHVDWCTAAQHDTTVHTLVGGARIAAFDDNKRWQRRQRAKPVGCVVNQFRVVTVLPNDADRRPRAIQVVLSAGDQRGRPRVERRVRCILCENTPVRRDVALARGGRKRDDNEEAHALSVAVAFGRTRKSAANKGTTMQRNVQSRVVACAKSRSTSRIM